MRPFGWIGVLVVLVLLMARPSEASRRFIDFTASGGIGKATISGDVTAPSVAPAQLGLSLGVKLLKVVRIGATSRFTLLTQTSIVGSEGNRSGWRFSPVSPMLGVTLGRFKIQGSYEFLGDYQLRQTTVSGASVSYQLPQGFTAEVLFLLKGKWSIGAYYQRLKFTEETTGTSRVVLANPMELTHYGGLLQFSL